MDQEGHTIGTRLARRVQRVLEHLRITALVLRLWILLLWRRVAHALRSAPAAEGAWSWGDRSRAPDPPALPRRAVTWCTATWPDARIELCDSTPDDPDRILLCIAPGVGTLVEVDGEGAWPSETTGDPLVRALRRDTLSLDVFDQLVRLSVLDERVCYVREWGPAIGPGGATAPVERLEMLTGCSVTLTLLPQDA